MKLEASYFILINIMTFFLFGEDKSRARQKKRRISERTLLFFAFLGGAAGAFTGMYIFHHKTRKPKFYLGVPAILILRLVCFYTLKACRLTFFGIS